jgi:hypothetical protein
VETWVFGLALLVGAREENLDCPMTVASLGLLASVAIALAQSAGWKLPWPEAGGPSGLFINRNFLAEGLAIVLVWQACQRRWLLCGALAVGLALTHSHAAGGAVAVAGAWAGWRRNPLVGTVVLVAGVCLAATLPGSWLSSGGLRLEVWRAALAHLTWLGHGIGSFPYLIDSWLPGGKPGMAGEMLWAAPHNELVNWVFELGVGAIAPVGLAIATWRGADEQTRCALLAGATVAAFGFPLHLPFTCLVLGLVCGGGLRPRRTVDRSDLAGGIRGVPSREWLASFSRKRIACGTAGSVGRGDETSCLRPFD